MSTPCVTASQSTSVNPPAHSTRYYWLFKSRKFLTRKKTSTFSNKCPKNMCFAYTYSGILDPYKYGWSAQTKKISANSGNSDIALNWNVYTVHFKSLIYNNAFTIILHHGINFKFNCDQDPTLSLIKLWWENIFRIVLFYNSCFSLDNCYKARWETKFGYAKPGSASVSAKIRIRILVWLLKTARVFCSITFFELCC